MVSEISFIKTCISKAPTDRISKKLEDILTELRMEKKKARAQNAHRKERGGNSQGHSRARKGRH